MINISKIPAMVTLISIVLGSVFLAFTNGQSNGQESKVDAQLTQDQLRGSITPEREWWDVKHYELSVRLFPDEKRIEGSNKIRFETVKTGRKIQIDLQQPMKIQSVKFGAAELKLERQGNVFWAEFPDDLPAGKEFTVVVNFDGLPKEATRPPWDGGVTWTTDENGKPFIVTTCQGIGASVWWPNKDHGYDEPDEGMKINVTVPHGLTAVANGRLGNVEVDVNKNLQTYRWVVTQPINNYCVNVNIGDYVNFSDKYSGEFGELDIEYWVLSHQREKAQKHFREVPRTIQAFEHWFGKYPFYEDSYKLVAVPYPGMEHQSSVTYGNGFKNGYRGRDLSNTGVGFKFDFIIVHESGHEWFGNNVSMKDVADMWIHEGFTNYSENLFVEYHFSEKEAQDYVIGCRKLVKNDRPIIGEYGFNREGSGDMYYKAGNMLHTMRHILKDDDTWLEILRGINKTYWHQVVTTQQIENYIIEQSKVDFSKFFDQYLRDTRIPKLVYSIDGNRLNYKFDDVVEGFEYPADVIIDGNKKRLNVKKANQIFETDSPINSFELARNFYYQLIEEK